MTRSGSWVLGLVAWCVASSSADAWAVTGPVTPAPAGIGVVALGTLPLACGSPFWNDCSGVAIAPTLILTAAHCVHSGFATERLQILVPAESESKGEILDVARTYVHPDYGASPKGFDVAILALDEPRFPLSIPISARDPRVGEVVSIHGFGATTALGSPSAKPFSGSVSVVGVDSGVVRIAPAPNMACDGDSGGPLLVPGTRGPELIGIISQADAACSAWGTATWLGSPSSRAFIDDVVAREGPLALAAEGSKARESAAYSTLCDLPCQADSDCPGGTQCVHTSEAERRCVPPGLLPGETSGACDDTCDECVQLSPNAEHCSCYHYCQSATPREVAAPACATSRLAPVGRSAGASTVAACAACLLLALARRGLGLRRRSTTRLAPNLLTTSLNSGRPRSSRLVERPQNQGSDANPPGTPRALAGARALTLRPTVG
jgi:hypothetical protein